MHYQEVTLKHSLYRVNLYENKIHEYPISGINFIPVYRGPEEKIDFDQTMIRIEYSNGTGAHHFHITDEGQILEEESEFYFDATTAVEELIIQRSKENHEYNMGVHY